MSSRHLPLLALSLTLLLAVGCALRQDRVRLAAGTWAGGDGGRYRIEVAAPGGTVLLVDDDAHDRVELAATSLPESEWSQGCRVGGGPFGTGGAIHLQETLTLGGPLQVEDLSFSAPVLVVRCPAGQHLRIAERGDPHCRAHRCLELRRVD